MIDPTTITVPSEHGEIVDRYVAPDPDAPLIALVQDVIGNYEARRAVAAIMARLMRDYGFDLVLTEGKDSASNSDLKKYRDKSMAVRISSAETLAREYGMDACGYLDLTSNYEFVKQGIEDMSLYQLQKELQMALLAITDRASEVVRMVEASRVNLKPHIASAGKTRDAAQRDRNIASFGAVTATLDEWLPLLRNLVGIRLVPSQWDFLRKNRDGFDLAVWIELLQRENVAVGVDDMKPDDIRFLVQTVEHAERFYEVAERRRQAFMQNIAVHLLNPKRDKAIVYVGGFHAPYLADMFREDGYSLLNVAPKFEFVRDYRTTQRKRVIEDLRWLTEGGRRTGNTNDAGRT